jgi:hypothetical protein
MARDNSNREDGRGLGREPASRPGNRRLTLDPEEAQEMLNWTLEDLDSDESKRRLLNIARVLYRDSQDLVQCMEQMDKLKELSDLHENQLVDQNQLLSNKVEQLKEDNRDLQGALRIAQQNQSRATSVEPPAQSSKNYQKLEDPAKFSGKFNTIEFDQWEASIRAKLRLDSSQFDSEDRRVHYTASRTEGEAYSYIVDRLNANEFNTAEELIAELYRIYDNPNKKAQARAKLAKLFQGSYSFHKFYNLFNTTIRPLNLQEEDKKIELTNKLDSKYLQATATLPIDVSFLDLVRHLHHVDKIYESAKIAEKARTQSTQSSQTSFVNQATTSRFTPSGSSYSKANNPQPENRTPLRTPEQKDILRANKLCLKCCQPDHIIANCTSKTWLPVPSQLKSVPVSILQAPQELDDTSSQSKN